MYSLKKTKENHAVIQNWSLKSRQLLDFFKYGLINVGNSLQYDGKIDIEIVISYWNFLMTVRQAVKTIEYLLFYFSSSNKAASHNSNFNLACTHSYSLTISFNVSFPFFSSTKSHSCHLAPSHSGPHAFPFPRATTTFRYHHPPLSASESEQRISPHCSWAADEWWWARSLRAEWENGDLSKAGEKRETYEKKEDCSRFAWMAFCFAFVYKI